MRMQRGIVMVGALVLAGCAGSAEESRQRSTTAAGESGGSGETATPEGGISPERQDAIERMFARKTAELQDCWAKEYDKTHNRKLEGDISISLEIQPSGSAQNVRILKSTINNPGIESCVQASVGNWSFPEGQTPVPYMRTVHLGAQF
jgi:hypothetical protein